VTGGDHEAAVELVVERGEVGALGTAQADVEHVDAGIGEAAHRRLGELAAGQADVVPHAHLPRLEECRVGPGGLVDQVRVDLVGDPATHVVGLEGGEVDH
jgi:hypothetical protein